MSGVDYFKRIAKNEVMTLIGLAIFAALTIVAIIILVCDDQNPEAILVGIGLIGEFIIMHSRYKMFDITLTCLQKEAIEEYLKTR